MYSNYRGPVDRNRGRIYKACPVKTGLCTTEPIGTTGYAFLYEVGYSHLYRPKQGLAIDVLGGYS